MVVPPEVRGALIAREIDSDDVLRHLTVPVLLSPTAAKTRSSCPRWQSTCSRSARRREASWYEAVGHMPFWEDHERFNRELEAFVAGAS